MATSFARQETAPIMDEPGYNTSKASGAQHGAWASSIFACCVHPQHLLAAIAFPCASAAYSARGIDKFPIAIGIAVALFFYGTAAFIALTVVDGDDQPAVTIGGMEFKAWQTGAGWALINYLGIVFMLRGWFRAFHNIPGNKCLDLPASFLFSCCALAQMSKHTASVTRYDAQTATLQGYGV
ncbi:hypothetical protein Gpo141_00004987 [Globisporangium polare]